MSDADTSDQDVPRKQRTVQQQEKQNNLLKQMKRDQGEQCPSSSYISPVILQSPCQASKETVRDHNPVETDDAG